jgi:lysozyme
MHKILNLRDQLIRDEANREWLYDDATGKPLKQGDRIVGQISGGVGRNFFARPLSHAVRELMLDEDITDHTNELLKRHPWIADLDDARKGVLLAMAFNLGIPGLSAFKLTLQAVRDGDYHLAAARMLLSKWAHQVGNRADRLALQMSSGQWQ